MDNTSENAKHAWRQAWHLAAGLLPSERYVCLGRLRRRCDFQSKGCEKSYDRQSRARIPSAHQHRVIPESCILLRKRVGHQQFYANGPLPNADC